MQHEAQKHIQGWRRSQREDDPRDRGMQQRAGERLQRAKEVVSDGGEQLRRRHGFLDAEQELANANEGQHEHEPQRRAEQVRELCRREVEPKVPSKRDADERRGARDREHAASDAWTSRSRA